MVDGLDRFNARWRKIPKAARVNVRAAMERTAAEIVDEMKRRAPSDTGALRDSIDWSWGGAPEGALTIGKVGGREYGALRIVIFAGGERASRKKGGGIKWRSLSHIKKGAFMLFRSPGFSHDYAKYQEFGTVKMPANPFFYPVWRARRRRVKVRISRAISKAIKES